MGWVCRKKNMYNYGELRFSSLGIIVIFRQHSLAGIDRFGLNLSDAKLCCFSSVGCKDPCCLTGYVQSLLPRGLYLWNDFVTCMLCLKMGYPMFPYMFPHSIHWSIMFPIQMARSSLSTWIRSDDQPRHHLHFPRLRFSVEGVGHYPPWISRKVLPSDGLWAYSIHKMWKTIICFFQKETHW